MTRKEEALRSFDKGFNCSQSVLGAFCEELGMKQETAFKIATGFGGGMRRAEVCGAVTGAIMAIGLKIGHSVEGDNATKTHAYETTKQFESRFELLNGSIVCRNILHYDLTKPEELAVIREKGLFDTVCTKAIADAVALVEEILGLEVKTD